MLSKNQTIRPKPSAYSLCGQKRQKTSNMSSSFTQTHKSKYSKFKDNDSFPKSYNGSNTSMLFNVSGLNQNVISQGFNTKKTSDAKCKFS